MTDLRDPRRERARKRRKIAVLAKGQIGTGKRDLYPIRGEEAISLLTRDGGELVHLRIAETHLLPDADPLPLSARRQGMIDLPVIGRNALLRNKAASGREQDFADIAA